MPASRQRDLADVWHQLRDVLQVESQVWRAGGLRCETAQGIGTRERPPEADVCRLVTRECGTERCHCKKALRPAERREVVTHLVTVSGLPVQRACRVVGMGRATYYRPLVAWARRDAPVIAALTTLRGGQESLGLLEVLRSTAA